MRVVGIDPGKTIGLCVYDTEARRVVMSECVTSAEDAAWWVGNRVKLRDDEDVPHVAIERPRIYQSAGNELCDTIEQTGWLLGKLGVGHPPAEVAPGIHFCPTLSRPDGEVYLLERRAVVGALSAVMGQQVRGDAGVWQALCALHPDALRRPVGYKPATRTKPAVAPVEGGPLYGVTSHARQAVAVAWALARHLEAV